MRRGVFFLLNPTTISFIYEMLSCRWFNPQPLTRWSFYFSCTQSLKDGEHEGSQYAAPVVLEPGDQGWVPLHVLQLLRQHSRLVGIKTSEKSESVMCWTCPVRRHPAADVWLHCSLLHGADLQASEVYKDQSHHHLHDVRGSSYGLEGRSTELGLWRYRPRLKRGCRTSQC